MEIKFGNITPITFECLSTGQVFIHNKVPYLVIDNLDYNVLNLETYQVEEFEYDVLVDVYKGTLILQ